MSEARDKEILAQQRAREEFREELLDLITKAMKPENPITPGDIMAEIGTVKMLVGFYIMENWKKNKEKKISSEIDDMLKGLDEL